MGTVVARRPTDAGKTWRRGLAIDVASAPNASVINPLGNGKIGGNIDIKDGDVINASGGATSFDGIVNPECAPGAWTTASGDNPALSSCGQGALNINNGGRLVLQDPRSGIAHENLASALGNGAQQVRTHLGKTDNANRSSVERIAMLKETIAETENARQLARTDQERVYYLLEQGRTLYTWGFPIDALDRMRAAYEIAPGNPTVERSFHGLEHELATGKRP